MQRIDNLSLAIDFLISSIDERTKGSAAEYSRIKHPFNGWSGPYPETTGYIIPTLFDASQLVNTVDAVKAASNMLEWLLSIQYEDGAFPGGVYQVGKEHQKSIFNTAQIIIGLVSAYEKTNEERYKIAFSKAAKWLVDTQDISGIWKKHNYQPGFFPSYYTRVAWPIIMAGKILDDNDLVGGGIRTLDFILRKKQKNHFIADSGFKPNQYAFLHTIAYTIRGFLEASFLLDRKDYYKCAYDLAKKLFRSFELKGKLGGAYNEKFKKVDWYRCLTGEAQMAIVWLKIFEKTNDLRFLNASTKILDQVCATQPKSTGLLLKKGGLKGSHPYYGKYLMFRQPNWATKFLSDAIMLESNCYQKLEQK